MSRRVSLFIAASLDGYIARPDGGIDWLPSDPAEDFGISRFLAGVDTVVMGRKTYEQVLTFGPWPYVGKRCLVGTRQGHGRRTDQVEFVGPEIAAVLAQLKTEPGGTIWLVGGTEINAACLAAGLVDEIVLTLVPVMLGSGIPLFPANGRPAALALRASQAYPQGLVQLTYDVTPVVGRS